MAEYEVNLLPAQRKFFEIPKNLTHGDKDVCIYQGGYGSGKTWVGSLLGITLCLKYPKIVGLVGAQTYKLVRDTTLQAYFDHLNKLNIKYTYNKQESILYFPNGSKIYFTHFDDDENFKSLNVGFIEIEECSQIEKKTFEALHGRLRQTSLPEWGNRFIYRLFGHTNPQANKGWIYEHFIKEKKKNYRIIKAPTTENIYLPKGYVESLKELYDEKMYAINVMGEDDIGNNSLVVKGFNESVQVDSSLKIDGRFPIHLTCDFNVDPMCWYICQNYNDNTYILFEICLENTTTDAAAQYVCDLLKNYKKHKLIINGDASGQSKTTKGADYIFLKNRLYAEGYENIETNLSRKNPSIEWRLMCFNNRIFGPDGKHHIFIHPQCTKLLFNFEYLETKAGTGKPKLPSSNQIKSDNRLKYLGHPIDAVSYLICYYYPIKDTTPWEEYQNNLSDSSGEDVFGNKYDTRLI